MAKDVMRYDRMVETALRGVVRDALKRAAEHGLDGEHHFYITFRTGHPGVSVPDYLHDSYPTEMTIVLQHQFFGLEVQREHFEVTLSFNNAPERLSVPYAAITIFADPSVNFALQFQPTEEGGEGIPKTGQDTLPDGADGDAAEKPPEPRGEVVSLDQFRRK